MQQENRRTVLIADPEPVFRAELRRVLEEELGRYDVVAEAGIPAEVTRLLRSTEPELVLMDLALARSLGLRVDRLGGLLPRPPKVVLLTGGGGHEGLDEALDAGARGFVTRDLDAGLLGAVLCHVLADGCAIAPEVFGGLMDRPSGCQAQFARSHHRVRLLNDSERQVLRLLGHGFENAQIAEELHLSRASVKTYVSRLLGKLHLDNRTQAALVANETGLAGRASP
ncbi:response regulator transcription factor (plasmid) [Streptomyces sp. NBC_01426]|uniref:response regulator transcription factor n=1 Tax=Streptomyces sp. NBC_01426 TaxID=2975866 RepID=UPI002E3599F9|nr:response regulator transcription factor [Streptomyces sp. NBC_01426]